MSASRFVVGIDLGTTNSALAYYDTGLGDAALLTHLKIPQVVAPGVVEERPLLPSFLYLPGPSEQPAGALKLPWAAERDYCVGEFARVFGSQVPTRLVASAKSWLCHSGVDRKAAILPWKAPENGRRISPLEATTDYPKQFVDAWNYLIAKAVTEQRPENQDIILPVPASFDAVARELTVEGARAAGLEKITLLEEPQAAFYAWIDASHDHWRDHVEVGDVVLVCDLGGGTTDLSLIAVTEEAGQLVLTRVAVGDHILLGGDNMDLAGRIMRVSNSPPGIKLDARRCTLCGTAADSRRRRCSSAARTRADHGAGRGSGHRWHDQGELRGRMSRRCWWRGSFRSVRAMRSRRCSGRWGCRRLGCLTRRIRR